MDENKLSIGNLAKGALAEQFEIELQKVLDNIYDPNTLAEKKRKIHMTLTFIPDETREIVKVITETKSQIVTSKPIGTKLLLGRGKDGHTAASEFVSDMPGQVELDDKVIKMNKEAK